MYEPTETEENAGFVFDQFTFKVEKVLLKALCPSNPVWTVIQYEDGQCNGGDHHWLSQRVASLARLLYESDEFWFGRSATDVTDELKRRGWWSE